MRNLAAVTEKLGLTPDDLIPYGRDKAKLPLSLLGKGAPGKLVLVSAITPTPAGEGKTTTTIGITQAMDRLGVKVCAALREPSLGPCFGIKGGGTGGGQSMLEPSVEINLHFTGDLHAVTAAHNLLSAIIDNHLHFRSEPLLDPRRVLWRRVIDQNDRSLRNLMVGMGGRKQGVPRETGFDITAASEVMAMLCLADDMNDLRARLDRTLIGYGFDGKPITIANLGATGAMIALLKDAIQPNLVQTTEGAPAIVHGGPFANIAHGCNSVIATRMAMGLADWTITEAGFGMDLGAEKFFDIKCVGAKLDPSVVVCVATVRALKYHGGLSLKQLTEPNPGAVTAGLPNLEKHLESVAAFGKPAVVALNRFGADTDEEIEVVRAKCAELGVRFAMSDHFMRGGEGAEDLAREILAAAEDDKGPFTPSYSPEDTIEDKIRGIARRSYGANDVQFTKNAQMAIKGITKLGYAHLPICIAKTQSSLSDDPKRRGRPTDFDITVTSISINAGAGFLVVLTGDIMRMPGLPRRPQALEIDVVDGTIVGIQ
ncbi:MAG: formate--tetrahydrofolate ligase [Rhodobacterales bacterium]|nr:formate--tetrahydrofolate ligase [Rhodobacterales bacterium]